MNTRTSPKKPQQKMRIITRLKSSGQTSDSNKITIVHVGYKTYITDWTFTNVTNPAKTGIFR